MKNYIIIIFLFSSFVLIAQDNSFPYLFTGKWKMDFDKVEIYEEWILVNDNELVGKSYSLKEGVKSVSENLYLKKFADQWAYVAIPLGQTPTLFTLIEDTGKRFVFENKEHDFPQRIIYEFHKDGKLTAAIEGNKNGEFERREFSFSITKN